MAAIANTPRGKVKLKKPYTQTDGPPTTCLKSSTCTPKRLQKTPVLPQTPECFTKVVMETPKESQRKAVKGKFDEISNLTVAVRIRPMSLKELNCVGTENVVRVRNQDLIIRTNSSGNSGMSLDYSFQYDHVFWSCDESNPIYSTQEDVYLTIGKPLLNSAFKGYNACLFAYGQTGSGKSFSMMGKSNSQNVDIDSDEYSGIIPRFCRDLFQRISELSFNSTAAVEISYFEIYNEKIHDLLSIQTPVSKTALKVREHPVWGPYVVDLSTHTVKDYNEIRNWLMIGNKNRETVATNMNEQSSRSHSIFTIEMYVSEAKPESSSQEILSWRSKVSLVDLAGSERLGGVNSSDERIKEGVYINKSLLTLGKVISALADQKKNQYIPYRDSVLTWLLKESLGGNSLTCMLATISPASSQVDETLATLRYACQARSIVNRARINENPSDRLIRELRSEVERLRAIKQTYERNSFSSNSSLQMSESSYAEKLEELQKNLVEANNQLIEAEKKWQVKFLETRKQQLREMAETERLREELESKERILKTKEEISLSPYRTDFFAKIENVLNDDHADNIPNENSIVEYVKQWCSKNNLETVLVGDMIVIMDGLSKRQKMFFINDIENLESYENIGDFINNLEWTWPHKSVKKHSKSEIVYIMNQIYQNLALLQPADNEDNLSLLYAKVNKALQCFETAMLSNVRRNSNQKTVTFNIAEDH